MSFINDFLEKITGLDLDGSDSKETGTVERPCANCPSNCAIAGTACSVCQPYKKKLIDAVYHIDHLDEYYDRYEVVSKPQEASGGTTHCTHCGANSADPYICEYCGSRLSEAPASSGKIQVSAASEIPNPIMEAQDIIWERYSVVIKQFGSNMFKNSTVKGSLIGDLFSQLLSSEDEADKETSALGDKMSEAEIREAASLYNVSVGNYMTGLDNGKYLTLKGKKEADAQGTAAASTFTPDSMGLPGMAAVGMFASSIFSNSSGRRSPQYKPNEPSHPVYRDISDRPSQKKPERWPSMPEQRPSSTRVSPERPVQDRSSSGRDVLERPSSKNIPTSTRRRPDSAQRVTPQKSSPSSSRSSGGPSKERHPENRRNRG